MIDREGNVIVAIVKGTHRISTSRVAEAMGVSGESLRMAKPEECWK